MTTSEKYQMMQAPPVKLGGLVSTCKVMDWIEQFGCPDLFYKHFSFPDDLYVGGFLKGTPRSIVVSSVSLDEIGFKCFLEDTPVESWHQVKPNQRRYFCEPYGWYACIKGKFYWMTT